MNIISKNKKAYYNYEVLDKYVAGIQLVGPEVKPVKNSKTSISEAYCYIHNGEIFIKGMYVSENKHTHKSYSPDPYRDRRLLLNKKEIEKLEKAKEQKGLTIVPLNIHETNTGLIKVTIGLCKGKKVHDKRNTIKARDIERDSQRELK
jgi:SsrA-binding protein